MKRILTITMLTLRAAIRYRLVALMSFIMLAGVIGLPLILKDDGTARGFTQILLAYTLTLITALLGFVTLWLACGTLAKEISESQMQLVAVKPIPRWQIWVGKWLGLVILNAFLIALTGVCVYFLLLWRANQLPADQQAILRNEILVARASIKEPVPNYAQDVEHILKERLATSQPPAGTDLQSVRTVLLEQVKARNQIVPPGYMRRWDLNLGFAKSFLVDRPLYVRTKFNAAVTNVSGAYLGMWEVGPLDTPKVMRRPMNLSDNSFHEFEISANLFDEAGVLSIQFSNASQTALLFSDEEGMELLYREGGFGLNFARGLAIVLCWISLLAALGLAASSLLSFPVAAFVTLGVLFVTFSSGTLKQVVDEGGIMGVNHETGFTENPSVIDTFAVPIAKALLGLLRMVTEFSPIDSLANGRSITWSVLAVAVLQIIGLLGGILATIGIAIFNGRELAATQGGS